MPSMPMIITLFAERCFSFVAMAGLVAEPVLNAAAVMAEHFKKLLRLSLVSLLLDIVSIVLILFSALAGIIFH